MASNSNTVYHPFADGFCQDTFWDASVTWNTDNPDLSRCFEQTVLTWLPCGFLGLMVPLQVYKVVCSHYHVKKWTWVSLTKISLCIFLAILSLAEFAYIADVWRREGHGRFATVDLVAPSLKAVTCAISAGFVYGDKRRASPSSGILLVYSFLLLVEGFVSLRTRILVVAKDGLSEAFPFVARTVALPVILVQFVLSCIAEHFSVLAGGSANPSPELMTSVAGRGIFSWFDGMAYMGWRRPLTQDDLWDLTSEDEVKVNVDTLHEHWQNELDKMKRLRRHSLKSEGKVHSPSLTVALIKSFWKMLLLGVLCRLTSDTFTFLAPQILRLIIQFTEDETEEAWKGYFYVLLLLLSGLTQSFLMNHYYFVVGRTGIRLRAAVMASVYRKSLRITSASKRSSNVGEIVNLMSVDAQRLYDFMVYLNLLWSSPLQIALSLFFLWQVLGVAAFAGLGILVLTLPLNVFVARRGKTIQVAQMKHKDARINTITEVLNGIKVLKLNAWEESFEKQILDIREQELKELKNEQQLEAVSSANWFVTPFFVAWSTFAVFVLMSPENVFNAEKVFVAMSLLTILRHPLTYLPTAFTLLIQCRVSISRLSEFLQKDELDPDNVRSISDDPFSPAVTVSDATLSWGKEEPVCLKNINLQIDDGQLVAVVGQVGCGKSSLVDAMLGLMEKASGEVAVKGTVAYVPQQAWIQNLTLKENILFGTEYNQNRYERVIEACALKSDLDVLDAGDETEIGEKGANLSGGQRQRVSLARAVYADADVYFLDDPLSAVDAHVGNHIFEHVIGPTGLLKGKTRILVTHGVGYLPQADLIVVVVQGAISEVGSYIELIKNDGAFAEFLRTYQPDDTDDSLPQEPVIDAASHEKADLTAASVVRQRTVSASSHTSTRSARKIGEVFRQESRLSARGKISGKRTGGNVGKLVDDELSIVGRVKWTVYHAYFKNVTYKAVVGAVATYALFNILNVGGGFWLSAWIGDSEDPVLANSIQQRDYRLGIYAMFGGLQAIFILASYLILAYGQMMASRNLHRNLLARIIRAPMSFFNTTPLGRIINRFSKDVEVLDAVLPRANEGVIYAFMSIISTLIVICYNTPYFTPIIIPVGIIYFFMQRFYIASALQIQRLDAISRSPIYSHFQESVQGSSVILATRQRDRFVLANERQINSNNKPFFLTLLATRWMATRMDFVGNFITFFAALFAVISSNAGWNISSENVGFSISYSLSVTQVLNWLVKGWCEMEGNIVSVERLKEYSEIETEAPWVIADSRPEKNWPQTGQINFNDYQTCYRKDLDLVLRGVNCHIAAGEKIGIVGRTGAGKSSLTLALFRIIEAAGGSIVIDGVNIANLGLQDVRSRITILPQEPVLFKGSLRVNLDPFKQFSDEEVWRALEHSHLTRFVSALPEGLAHMIAEGGENLSHLDFLCGLWRCLLYILGSMGQRQLICLARALLRKTKVLVLDEATAAIDLETDALIQDTIRNNFADCTVLTIAHRINTIMDSTRIMVLDQGRVKEFDSPAKLLADTSSIFFSLAKSANLT